MPPATLPAIIPLRPSSGATESLPDNYGIPAATAALRGALFEASGRASPGLAPMAPGSPSRPLSAHTASLLMQNPGLNLLPGSTQVPLPAGMGGAGLRGSNPAVPATLLGALASGAVGGGQPTQGQGQGSGLAEASGGGGVGLAGPAAAAMALRTAAESLVSQLEAAVVAREAQNRALLTVAKDSVAPAGSAGGGGSGAIRPASARALDRALSMSRTVGGGSGLGPAVTDDKLAWVRNVVRQTEGGQVYAAAAEERERERASSGGVEASGGSATGLDGSLRRGMPLPALRPTKREDALHLQSWLADTLQQVMATAAKQQQQQQQQHQHPPSAAAAAEGPAAQAHGDPGLQAASAAELADAALYVVGCGMEELRRQVAAECRERGELLGALAEQQAGLVALRGALAAEARAAEVAAAWSGVLAERDRLAQDGAAAAAAEGAEGAGAGEAAAAAAVVSSAGGLAAQLMAAQQAAAAATRRFALADAALAGEVARRAAAEQQLEAARELLRRQEAEWLHHRTMNQRFEAERAALRDAVEAAKRQAAEATTTATVARDQTKDGREEVARLEAALAAMRQQYEGNEILVVAQRQQVRELESALSDLREQHRQQAVALGKVGKVTEQYETAAANLRADLEEQQARVAELTEALAGRTNRLTEVEESLAAMDRALSEVRATLKSSEAAAAKASEESEATLRRLRLELADAVEARRQETTRREELEREANTITELVKLVARTMILQGLEGVPNVNDKSWDSPGPLGAAQRTLGLTTQQLAMLFGHSQDMGRELRAATSKLAEEKEANARLQRELNTSKTAEAKMIRDKEVLDMRVAALEADLRAVQSDALKQRAAAVDSEARIKVQHETIMALQAQVKELPPLKKRVDALHIDLETSKKSDEEAREALFITRVNLDKSEETVRYYKSEVERLLAQIAGLQEDIKGLRVAAARLDEEQARVQALEAQVTGLTHQLDVTAESHSETLRQLELAKFFLQGLESNAGKGDAPGSPTRIAHGGLNSPHRTGTAGGNTTSGGGPASPSRSPGTSPSRFSNRPGAADPTLTGDGITGGGGADASGGGSAAPSRPYSAFSRVGGPPPPGALVHSVGGGAGGSRPGTAGSRGSRPTSALPRGGRQSRPMSAASIGGPDIDPEDSMFHTDMPREVFEIMEARGLLDKVNTSNAKWANVKIGIMAWFSGQLRKRLLEVTEQLAGKDLEIAQLHVSYLTEMQAREEFISKELLPTLIPAMESAMKDSQREVLEVRSQLPFARRDLDAIAANCAVLALSLKGYREREANASNHSTQTDVEAADDWSRFAAGLPPLRPQLSLSLASLTDTIVRIYTRAEATIEDVPTWGPTRQDTVQDAVMAHYSSQRAPGTFIADLIRDPESPIARLLGSAQLHARNTKVACFLYFLGLSPEGVHWPSPAWHFFLHTLHCLRILTAGTWRVLAKRWGSPEGVQIPMPAVLDLVGNMFNVQAPGDLDGAVSVRLAAIIAPGAAGPAVDLDALLLLLIREYNSGNCPRAPLLFPRRLTDGQLFNIFNSAGHNAHVGTLRASAAEKFIGAPVGSSSTQSRRGGARPDTSASIGSGGYGPGSTLSRPGTSASAGLMSPGTPQALLPRDGPYAAAHGQQQQPHLTSSFSPQSTYNLSTSSPGTGGVHPHTSSSLVDRGLGDLDYPAGAGGSRTNVAQVDTSSRLMFHANVPDLGEGNGVGVGAAEPPNPGAGGPGGSMTVSFEIGHQSHRVAAQASLAAQAGGSTGLSPNPSSSRLTALPSPVRPKK
ncbi:hypothetical protein HYH02_006396 [Chlamydomonas schloesseri]|uniref:Uncharacterized protein n=1 Tax=Chlamydomonas schloesseri TaxID=2026947 RepID=A0A836B5Y3_9CHLO|nr:hypothetical protein HYH02_006396 [Chlamydomonas schloesseri]|eukprot:KAG2448505.1 hypothetical protein HYH02_006396 [Chlamydomonas schloesseri]